jgi:putative transposase
MCSVELSSASLSIMHCTGTHFQCHFIISPSLSTFNLKGKSTISIAKKFRGRQRNFNGEHFWVRGYYVSTVGLDEEMVLEYIRNQEKDGEHRDQLRFGI